MDIKRGATNIKVIHAGQPIARVLRANQIVYDATEAAPSAPLGSIAISSPKSYQTFQSSGNLTHSIPANGTFVVSSGTLTGIEVSWNGGSWIDATVGSGVWAATLPDQPEGQGSLIARFKNNTSVNASVQYITIDDIFIVAGQSNADGQFTSFQAYTRPTSGKRSTMCRNGAWAELAEPAKINTSSTKGTPWGPLTNRITASYPNKSVSFIPTAKGSTGLVNPANWAKGGTEYTNFINYINASKINSAKCILWYQGEQDAQSATTKAQYKTALIQMVQDMRSDLGGGFSNIKLMPVAIGNTGSTDQAYVGNLAQMRLAVQELWDDRPDLFVPGFTTYDNNFSDESGDGVHWASNAEAQTLASRWWRMISSAYYGGTEGRSFKYSSISVSGNQVAITFTGGVGNVAGASTAGWIVTDNNGSRTVTAASSSGKTITLTCDQTLSGTVVVQLGYRALGNSQAITIKDQGTIAALPPETFEASQTVAITPSPSPSPAPSPTPDYATELFNAAMVIWRFDNNTWTAAKGGSAYTLTPTGTVTNSTGLAGDSSGAINASYQSALFNGSSNLNLADSSLLHLPDEATVILVMQKTLSSSTNGAAFLIGKIDTTLNQRQWGLGLQYSSANTTSERFQMFHSTNGSSSVVTDGPLFSPRNAKHMCILQRSVASGYIRFSTDNGAFTSVSLTTPLFQSTAKFAIGSIYANGALASGFTGRIDNVAIIPSIVSQAALDWVWNNGNIHQI